MISAPKLAASFSRSFTQVEISHETKLWVYWTLVLHHFLMFAFLRNCSTPLSFHTHEHSWTHKTVPFTCFQDPVETVRGPGWGPAGPSWGAGVGRGGWGVGLWREVWRRVTSLNEHLGCAEQTHTVLAGEENGLLHHLFTHRAAQLLLQTLRVRLEEGGKVGLSPEKKLKIGHLIARYVAMKTSGRS